MSISVEQERYKEAGDLLEARESNSSTNNSNINGAMKLLAQNVFKPKIPGQRHSRLQIQSSPHLPSVTLLAKCIKYSANDQNRTNSQKIERYLLVIASWKNEPNASWLLGRVATDPHKAIRFYEKALHDGIEEPVKSILQKDLEDLREKQKEISQTNNAELWMLANACDQHVILNPPS